MAEDESEGGAAITPESVRRRVAMNVTELRLRHGLSQGELAGRSGLTERDVQDIEAGIGEMLLSTLSSVAWGLGVDIERIFEIRRDKTH
jgi:transcriptional regulator with XRE-family HTH domain